MINFSLLKKLIIATLALIFFVLFTHKAFSAELTQEEKELKAMYYKGVNDEIVRNHEKQMADRQIEILGRLQMLGASNTEVNQGVTVENRTPNNCRRGRK